MGSDAMKQDCVVKVTGGKCEGRNNKATEKCSYNRCVKCCKDYATLNSGVARCVVPHHRLGVPGSVPRRSSKSGGPSTSVVPSVSSHAPSPSTSSASSLSGIPSSQPSSSTPMAPLAGPAEDTPTSSASSVPPNTAPPRAPAPVSIPYAQPLTNLWTEAPEYAGLRALTVAATEASKMRKKEAQEAVALGKATIIGRIWTSARTTARLVSIAVKSFPNFLLQHQQEVLSVLPKATEWVQIYDPKQHDWVMTGLQAVRRLAANETELLIRVFPDGPSGSPLGNDECLGLPEYALAPPHRHRLSVTVAAPSAPSTSTGCSTPKRPHASVDSEDEPALKRSKVSLPSPSPSPSPLTQHHRRSPSFRNAMSSPGPSGYSVDKRPTVPLPRQRLFMPTTQSPTLPPISEDDVPDSLPLDPVSDSAHPFPLLSEPSASLSILAPTSTTLAIEARNYCMPGEVGGIRKSKSSDGYAFPSAYFFCYVFDLAMQVEREKAKDSQAAIPNIIARVIPSNVSCAVGTYNTIIRDLGLGNHALWDKFLRLGKVPGAAFLVYRKECARLDSPRVDTPFPPVDDWRKDVGSMPTPTHSLTPSHLLPSLSGPSPIIDDGTVISDSSNDPNNPIVSSGNPFIDPNNSFFTDLANTTDLFNPLLFNPDDATLPSDDCHVLPVIDELIPPLSPNTLSAMLTPGTTQTLTAFLSTSDNQLAHPPPQLQWWEDIPTGWDTTTRTE